MNQHVELIKSNAFRKSKSQATAITEVADLTLIMVR